MMRGSVRHRGPDYPVPLYILAPDHKYVRGWLTFREYMRRHPDEVLRYADVKRALLGRVGLTPGAISRPRRPYLQDLATRIGGE